VKINENQVLSWYRAAIFLAKELPMSSALDTLRRAFLRFAEIDAPPRSPLYVALCHGIATDPDALALAALAPPGQPAPNLLLAAVHDLLLRGTEHPLRAFYPDLVPNPAPPESAYPAFRAFLSDHRDEIAVLLRARLVQTAQVRRCAVLLPALALVHARGGGLALALIEVGASAGLNLLIDRYAYSYSDDARAIVIGDPSARLTLSCELRGAWPPLPATLPLIAFRLGLDLHPIDAHDPEATRWLRALIWPDEAGRARDLEAALAIASADPPPLIAGDALATLPGALQSAPAHATVVVYHSHTLNQFAPAARERFDALLREASRARPLCRVAMEFAGTADPEPSLTLFTYEDGERRDEPLGVCEAHGAWLAWQGPTHPVGAHVAEGRA
jgi:hypothetical protein